MIRLARTTSSLAAVAAAVLLAGCGTSDDATTVEDAATDAATADGAAETADGTARDVAVDAPGGVVGTVADVDLEAGTVTVTTADGDVDMTLSSAAYVEVAPEDGARQRTRLSTWLQHNGFGDEEYTFVRYGGQVTDILG